MSKFLFGWDFTGTPKPGPTAAATVEKKKGSGAGAPPGPEAQTPFFTPLGNTVNVPAVVDDAKEKGGKRKRGGAAAVEVVDVKVNGESDAPRSLMPQRVRIRELCVTESLLQ